jgi:two-component system sensor histidine kinase KdpD
MRRHRFLYGTGRGLRAVVIGVLLPAAATLLAALPIDVSTTTAALVYVLAVTAAAALGGLAAGLAASMASFLTLNFFFTPPFHTFVVTKPEDLIALVVFLLVSATVGTLISTTLFQRARAERREREVSEARQEAETNRLRAALFSSVTHDLRTPLSSITASVTGLLAEEATFTPEDRRELLETIRHEADRLNRVVGNLLDLSRMRAGALAPSMSPASIDELVEGVVGRLEPLLRRHELVVSLPEDLPDVQMDVGQMDQVLTNLLENAARFTPEGRRIAVSVQTPDQLVRLCVEDAGRSIEPSERERVFEPFVRGKASPGTGLGLAIARAIVSAHGGRIWIEAAALGGTAVVLELPRPS